jgi:hypothetical protein
MLCMLALLALGADAAFLSNARVADFSLEQRIQKLEALTSKLKISCPRGIHDLFVKDSAGADKGFINTEHHTQPLLDMGLHIVVTEVTSCSLRVVIPHVSNIASNSIGTNSIHIFKR